MSNQRHCTDIDCSTPLRTGVIRDFPDHATFREKTVTTCLVGQAWGFLSLTLCNKANFDPILLVNYDVLQKGLNMKKFYRMFSFP